METIEQTLARWLSPWGRTLPPVVLVGGAVRDFLLGRRPKDIDLMTADPESFAHRMGTLHDAAVVPFTRKTDMPCFRVVSRRQPDDFVDVVGIWGSSVASDLARRDFTINSMAIRLEPGGRLGEIIDPLAGRDDLKQRMVRASGPSGFRDDPLRIVRAARFAAELGFGIAVETVAGMRSAAAGLSATAAERITAELFALLRHPGSTPLIRLLDETDALTVFLPEIVAMKSCPQNGYHHLAVWPHSLLALEQAEQLVHGGLSLFGPEAERISENLGRDNRLAVFKLAVLLHDVGKPAARSLDRHSGRIIFHGHDRIGADLAQAVSRRLKFASRDQSLLIALIEHHMLPFALSGPRVKARSLARWVRRLGEDLIPLLLLHMADTLAALGPSATPDTVEQQQNWARQTIQTYFQSLRERLDAAPFITGLDLKSLGMAPGPEMGRILRAVREAQDAALVTNRSQALALAAKLRSAARR